MNEWRKLPWWQTRLYLEYLEEKHRQAETAVDDDGEMVEMVPAEAVGIVWS